MEITNFNQKIELENSGNLQLFFVGTGSAFNKKKFQNNLLVIKGKNHILIDCGTLCPYALSKYNTPIQKIKAVLPTHSHADHIGGIEELIFSNMYISSTKPKIIITDEFKKKLWNSSLKGGISLGEQNGIAKKMHFEDYFEQIKPKPLKNTLRPMYEIFYGDIKLTLFRTIHIPSSSKNWKKIFYSVGVLIDDKILFTGDTRFDPKLINYFSKNYKLEAIFHDCQFFCGGIHTFYEDLKSLPQEIKKNLYLCHYGENYEEFLPQKDGFAGFAEPGIYYNF